MAAALAAGRSGITNFVAADMGGPPTTSAWSKAAPPPSPPTGTGVTVTTSTYHGRHPQCRCRWRIDRPGPPGRPARRSGERGLLTGPGLLRQGGERATVTDADAYLGYLPAKGFAGGRMELDVDAARRAIEDDVAKPLGVSVDDAAWAIQRIVNANMANAVRKVLSSHGADREPWP